MRQQQRSENVREMTALFTIVLCFTNCRNVWNKLVAAESSQHILTSSVIYNCAELQQHGIYLFY